MHAGEFKPGKYNCTLSNAQIVYSRFVPGYVDTGYYFLQAPFSSHYFTRLKQAVKVMAGVFMYFYLALKNPIQRHTECATL